MRTLEKAMKVQSGNRRSVLYPMLIVAAISAIVFSLLGVVTVSGVFAPTHPHAQSAR